jgi:hypothetical protein
MSAFPLEPLPTFPVENSTCAVANVAWPQSSTSKAGVNLIDNDNKNQIIRNKS